MVYFTIMLKKTTKQITASDYHWATADMTDKAKFLSGTTAHHLTNLLPHAEAPNIVSWTWHPANSQSYDQATTWRAATTNRPKAFRALATSSPIDLRDLVTNVPCIGVPCTPAMNARRLGSYFRTCVWTDRPRVNRPSIRPYVPPIDRASRVGKQALSATRTRASLYGRIVTLIYSSDNTKCSIII